MHNVTKTTARIRSWPRAFGLLILPVLLAGFGMVGTTFHWPHATAWLLAAPISVLLICIVVGRDIRSILFGVYGVGLMVVFLVMAGPHFVQSLILRAHGEIVQAQVAAIVTDPAYPGGSDLGCRSCSHTHGYVFKTSTGRTLPGNPYGNASLHIGDWRPVVIDPHGRIDSRAPQEVQPWRDGFWVLLSLAIAGGLCWQSNQSWEQRKRV